MLADLSRRAAVPVVVAEIALGIVVGPQVLDLCRRLLTAKNRLDAELTRVVREGELTQASEHDGAKTMQSWLRGHGRFSTTPGKLLRSMWTKQARWR